MRGTGHPVPRIVSFEMNSVPGLTVLRPIRTLVALVVGLPPGIGDAIRPLAGRAGMSLAAPMVLSIVVPPLLTVAIIVPSRDDGCRPLLRSVGEGGVPGVDGPGHGILEFGQ